MNAETAARIFGCTVEQSLALYARNAEQLRGMLQQARTIAPHKYRGFTVAELERDVARFEALARGETV